MIRHARMRGQAALFLPGLDHASIAAQFVLDGIIAKDGESRQSLGRDALPRADAGLRRRDPRRHARPAAPGRRLGRLGAAALHDGRRLGARPSGSRSSGSYERRSRVPDRGPRQLVPGLPDERQRPRGRPDPGDRHALVDPLPPASTRRRASRSGRDDHGRDDPAGDDPRRHGGRRPSGRRAVRARWSGGACGSRSWSATCRSSPTTSSSARSGRAPSRSRRPTITTITRRACATASRCRRSSTTPRRSRTAARATTAWTATPPGPRSSPISAARGDLAAEQAHEMVVGRCQRSRRRRRAAAQDPVVHPDRAARGEGAGRHPVGPDPDRAGALREDLGALADRHPRLERLAPAVVGPSDPGVVLPGRPRHGLGRARRARAPATPAPGRPPSSARTRTSSIRGSARACGRSRPSAGPTTPPTSDGSTRRRSWRRATTSSSSGSPG